MTDPVDVSPGGATNNVRPKRDRVTVAQLSLIVRPPRRPGEVQAFTAAEADDAARYAAAVDATVEPLAGRLQLTG